jgi:ATP-dependent Lhr-like helicase|tara:strand:+ start:382 stop:627 length:246 start_codon:yes stop_codon:yes gene_type:complete
LLRERGLKIRWAIPPKLNRKLGSLLKKKHTLIAAPTGSGKTLATFYAAIDDLITLGLNETLVAQTYVVYISPLKAFSNDIH